MPKKVSDVVGPSSNVEPDHPGSLTLQLPSGPSNFTVQPAAKGRKVTSFSSWMEAWNIYLTIRVDFAPSSAPSLIAYQRIITSASVSYPLQSWLNYDVQFRMLAASNPSLRWDTRHHDLWLQCITLSSVQQSSRWPCPFCGATNHFPDRCPFRANFSRQLPSGQRNDTGGQSSGARKVLLSPKIPQVTQGMYTAGISTFHHVHVTSVSLPMFVNTVVPITQPGAASEQDPSGPPTRPQPWSPIRPFALERELSLHPDKIFVKQLVNDLQHGCSIGYMGPQFAHLAKNLPTAYQQPDVIDATLQRECEAGRILGPFISQPLPNFRSSGLGLIPKHDGGWQIIYHLSAPQGSSINDYIDSSLYSLSYCSIDDAYRIINKLGPGVLLSKIDLKDAFRLIPV